jgi:hypothetical protein
MSVSAQLAFVLNNLEHPGQLTAAEANALLPLVNSAEDVRALTAQVDTRVPGATRYGAYSGGLGDGLKGTTELVAYLSKQGGTGWIDNTEFFKFVA